jgi:hypothetical protein
VSPPLPVLAIHSDTPLWLLIRLSWSEVDRLVGLREPFQQERASHRTVRAQQKAIERTGCWARYATYIGRARAWFSTWARGGTLAIGEMISGELVWPAFPVSGFWASPVVYHTPGSCHYP